MRLLNLSPDLWKYVKQYRRTVKTGVPFLFTFGALYFAAVLFFCFSSVTAYAKTFYAGRPWCERPIISGAARGSSYTYQPPPARVTNHRSRSVDTLRFLLHQADTAGGQNVPPQNRALHYQLQAALDWHTGSFSNSSQSPFISVSTLPAGAKSFAKRFANMNGTYPGELLVIEVPEKYVCSTRRWINLVAASGKRVYEPDDPIFSECLVFETFNRAEDEWLFVHEIPESYLVDSYPWPDTNKRFGPNCKDTGVSSSPSPSTTPNVTTNKRSGKLQGKKATGKSSSSSTEQKDKILELGGVQINLTTLYQAVVEYLKKQMQSALDAKVEEVKGQFQQAAEGYAQVLYQDFLFWLNEKVHEEIASQYPIDSQEFENEFMAWLNSPDANVKKYINQYISEQSPTIGWLIQAYQDQASWEIVGGLKEIWGDAKNKYDKFTRAYDEVLSDPKTPYAETLKKYGFSGPWIDKFKSYEGQFNVFNDRYKAVQAVDIVTGAFQSDVPRDKINALFNLMELMGGVAEESNIPIVSFFGQIVKAYGNVANSMLNKIDDLAKKLRERQGYCLGVGTTTDERNVAFVKAFGDAFLVCPTNLSPDIYERVEPADGRIYFWADGKFIEGQERGGGISGVREAVALITEAATLGYPNPERYKGKESDIATIARFYNTQYENDEYGSGIPGLRKESEATIDGIGRQIDALRSGIVTVGEHACKIEDLDNYLQSKCGLTSKFKLQSSAEEASFADVKRELKVFYTVSYVDGKGGAYQTYSEIWKKIKPLSIMTLHGYVREKGKTDQKCPRCAGAAISLTLTEASEMEGCKATKADSTGDFVAHIITTNIDFNVKASASVNDKKSEESKIDKTTLGIDKLPFVSSFSLTLAVPLEDTQEQKDLQALLEKLKGLKDRALALNAKRSELNNLAAKAGKAAGEAESGVNSANEKLGELKNRAAEADELALLCNEASGIINGLKSRIDGAEAREKAISDSLTEALKIAQACNSREDAQLMRDSYKKALTAMKEFSKTKTGIETENEALKEKLKNIDEKKGTLKKAGELAGGISDDVTNVKNKADDINASIGKAESLKNEITSGAAQLRAEIEALYGTLSEERLTESIKTQFDELRSLVASADMGIVDLAALTARAKESVNRVTEINTKAQEVTAKYKNATCGATPPDDIIGRMDDVINSLGFEIAVTSDLPQSASDCIAKLDAGPTPTPTTEPAVTGTPAPSPTATPVPSPEPTPVPTPVETPVPTPTPTQEPTGEIPPSIAGTEVVPDSTPMPTPIPTEEPTGEIPPSIAGTEVVPEATPEPPSVPTPAPVEEPTGEIPPSIAGTEVVEDPGYLGGECVGTIIPTSFSGYEGEPCATTITISPPYDDIIVKVTTHNPLCQDCDAEQTGKGTFVFARVWAGKGPFTITFDAFDKDGKIRCSGSTKTMTALGSRE